MNLYEKCGDLFARYPLAAHNETPSGHSRSMVLMLPQGRKPPEFYVLCSESAPGEPAFCWLSEWRDAGCAEIGADGRLTGHDSLPHAPATILERAVPIPPDGSLFGWVAGRQVTALVTVSTQYTPQTPTPTWTLMPLAGSPQSTWPPFAGETLLGPWFWEHLRAGRLVDLGPHIARTSGQVWWVDTVEQLNSNTAAVDSDLPLPGGTVLPQGLYVYRQVLLDGAALPALEQLVTSRDRTDLGPRFREAA